MTKRISTLFVLTVAFAALLVCLNVAAQNTITGEWKAELVKDGSKINVNFQRRSESEGRNEFGHTFEFSELGLTKEQVQNGGPVTFRLAREAGTIDAEGSFQNGKGTGTFRFTPNMAFLSAMKSRGFDLEKGSEEWKEQRPIEDRLFTAASLNVTTALADDLVSANFGKLDVGDLFKAAIFKIDSAYMREMKATGFPNLSFDDLVKARIFKIDAAFVRRANEMGFSNQSFDGLVKMSIFKVTPEFLAEVRNEGLTDLTIEDVVKLRIFKIDGEFIRKAKADGVPLNVEDLVKRKLGTDRTTRSSRRVII